MEKLISPTKRSKSDIPGLDSPLLVYAFVTLNFVRAQFMTDELNEKSGEAILRIGAKQEGIIRHEGIMAHGRKCNSVFFSIIDTEWPEVKARLKQKIVR